MQNTTDNLDVYLTFEGTEFRNNISGTGAFTWYTGGGEKFRIDNNGNVGVGIANPSQNLTVNAGAATFALTAPGGPATFLIGNRDSLGVNNPNIITAANGNLYFGGGNSWSGSGGTHDLRMVVNDNGNIGIGGTLPSSPNISLNADGSASFASSMELTDSHLDLYCQTNTPGSTIFQLFSDIGPTGSHLAKTEKAAIMGDGSARFAGTVSVANFNSPSSSTAGINLYDSGAVYVRRTDSSPVFRGYDGSTVKSEIGYDGSTKFATGRVHIDWGGGLYLGTAPLDVVPLH